MNNKTDERCVTENDRGREGERDEPAFILSVFHTLVSISVSLSAESTSERKTDSELDRVRVRGGEWAKGEKDCR